MVSLQQAIDDGKLRIEDLNENSSSRGGGRFAHDVLDVFFHGLFCDLKSVGNFLICPAFSKMLDNGLFTISELKFLSGQVRIEVLLPAKFLHRHNEARMIHPSPIREAKSSKKYGLIRITCDPLDLELFPILGLSPHMEGFDDLSAQLCEGGGKDSVSRSRCISDLFRSIDLFGEFRGLPIHMEQLHRSGQYHNA